MLPFLSIGGLNIPSYGMCIVFGIILASLWVKIDPHWKDIDFDFFILISACIFGSGFLGAKIAFVLITLPISFQAFISSFGAPGGFVFYGGLLGGALGYLIGIKISRQRNADYIKIYAVLIPFCHAFGRIGCYLAGCCYGKPYSGFLAIPSENVAFGKPEDISYFPIQLVEAVFLFAISAFIYFFTSKYQQSRMANSAAKNANPFFIYLFLYSLIRFILEFFRGDSVRGILSCGLSISQAVSLILFILSSSYILFKIWLELFAEKQCMFYKNFWE